MKAGFNAEFATEERGKSFSTKGGKGGKKGKWRGCQGWKVVMGRLRLGLVRLHARPALMAGLVEDCFVCGEKRRRVERCCERSRLFGLSGLLF